MSIDVIIRSPGGGKGKGQVSFSVSGEESETVSALLKSSRDSLERIAAECGFCDANHLSKRFTAVMGLPPGTFRRNCRKENASKS